MAEDRLGVTITSQLRSGGRRWRLSGSVATAMKQREVAMASRATGRNSSRPNTWKSAETMKAPANEPVMYGYITIISDQWTWMSLGKAYPVISGITAPPCRG